METMSWDRLPTEQLARAERLRKEAIFLNGLDSTHWDKFTEEYIRVLNSGGVNALNVTIPWVEDDFRGAIRSYARWQGQFRQIGPTQMTLVRSVSDIDEAKRTGKIAVIMGFQNSKPIEDDLDLVQVFRDLGVRIMQLTYNRRNYIGDGCAEDAAGGLSKYGVLYIKRLNESNLVVDLSHSSYKTAMHALEVSSTPPIMSHTCMKALCAHFRCVPDDLVRAIADRGGVVGLTALSIFLRDDGLEKGSTLDDFLNHLEHAIEIAGVEHVGIGFDVGYLRNDEDTARLTATYPEFRFPPLRLRYCEQLNRADKSQSAIHGMIARGFKDDDIKRILGGNFLRIFREVWKG
jgi:membrane dipeptidase